MKANNKLIFLAAMMTTLLMAWPARADDDLRGLDAFATLASGVGAFGAGMGYVVTGGRNERIRQHELEKVKIDLKALKLRDKSSPQIFEMTESQIELEQQGRFRKWMGRSFVAGAAIVLGEAVTEMNLTSKVSNLATKEYPSAAQDGNDERTIKSIRSVIAQ